MIKIFPITILLIGGILFAAANGPEVINKLPANERQAIHSLLKKAKTANLPAHLLHSKIHEGLAKGKSGTQIIEALQKRYKALHTIKSDKGNGKKFERELYNKEIKRTHKKMTAIRKKSGLDPKHIREKSRQSILTSQENSRFKKSELKSKRLPQKLTNDPKTQKRAVAKQQRHIQKQTAKKNKVRQKLDRKQKMTEEKLIRRQAKTKQNIEKKQQQLERKAEKKQRLLEKKQEKKKNKLLRKLEKKQRLQERKLERKKKFQ